MPDTGKGAVVFQGSKFFWRTRNSIDVTIVQHEKTNITEIIAYEPSIDVEATRIYLNSTLLRDRLDQVEIDAKFSFAKQNNVPISTAFITSVMNHAITDYILTRILISEFSKEESRFEIKLEFSGRDTDPAQGGIPLDGLFCSKVEELKPFETKNHKILAPGEVDAALQALEEERVQLKASCEEAAIHHTEASVPLTVKERWRIPIVLIKMDKGKVLNAGDAKIWAAVSRNLKTQADIDRVTKVTMRTVTTKAQLDAKNAVKRRYHAPSPANRVGASPARSPMPTPRSQSVTPRATPRNASSRLYAGTVTSQTRAQCSAEDNAVAPTTPKTPKKLAKRGSSSRAIPVRNSSKVLRRASTRSRMSGSGSRDNNDANVDNSVEPDIDYSGSMDYSAALIGIGENTRGSFVSQVAAGLSTLAASFSTKTKPSTASSKASRGMSTKTEPYEAEAGQFPTQASFGAASGDLSDPAPVHHHLSDLVSYLVRGKSSSHNLTGERHTDKYAEATANSDDIVAAASTGKHKIDQTGHTNTLPASAPMSTEPSLVGTSRKHEDSKDKDRTATVGPTKRRSFFGAMLAPFVRADSNHSHMSANTGAHGNDGGDHPDSPMTRGAHSSSNSHKTKTVPTKRRSFFGALLSSLGRADSGHSVASANASVANMSMANGSVANASVANGSVNEEADAVGELPGVEAIHKIKPGHHSTISESLTSWLPWGHGHAAATVVPVDLAEFTRTQLAE